MCAGGQDIPVTLRVAGGVEGGQWKSENDVRATPQPEEEVETTETTEVTEPVEPSAPLYQPVIDRINKLSEKLPDEVADETVQEMQPMMQHGWSMNDRNYMQTRQLLDRIMHNTRPRGPRPPRPGGPGKWGGGGKQPWGGNDPRRPPQTLGTNPQVAGLAGLFAGPQTYEREREQVMPQQGIPVPQMGTLMPARNPVHPFTGQWRGSMSQPMQPAVMEEQQMEVLGQPKQFANGGIVNALMATPVGQAAIRQYATGGEVGEDIEAEQVLEHTPTGATIEDILAGRATFFNPFKYRHGEVISDISDTLGVTPTRKKREPTIEYQDSEGGDPTQLGPTDYGWASASGPELFGNMPGGKSIDPNTGQPYDADPNYDPSKVGMKSVTRGPSPHAFDPLKAAAFIASPILYSQWEDKQNKEATEKGKEHAAKYTQTAAGWKDPNTPFQTRNLQTNKVVGTAPNLSLPGDPGTTTPTLSASLGNLRGTIADPEFQLTKSETPAQAIKNSTAELINYDTKPRGQQLSHNNPYINSWMHSYATPPLDAEIEHGAGKGGITTPSKEAEEEFERAQIESRLSTPTGISSLAQVTKSPTKGISRFSPTSTGLNQRATKGGLPSEAERISSTPMGIPAIDPDEFDPSLWGPTINPNTPLGALAHAYRSLQAPPLSDAVLADIHKTPIQDLKVQDMYKQTIPEGYNYSGTTQPDIDVQSQVDTFSEIAGVGGGMDDDPAEDQGMYE